MDPIEFPETLTELSVTDLDALETSGRAALTEMFGITDPTPAQAQEAEALAANVNRIVAEKQARVEAATRLSALRDSFTAAAEEPAAEEAPAEEAPAEQAEEAPAEESTETEEASTEETTEVTEPATEASLNTAAVAGQRPPAPANVPERRATIHAAADVPGVGTGATMSVDQLAETFLDKLASFPQPSGSSDVFGTDLRTFGHAKISRNIPDEVMIKDGMGSQDIEAAFNRAIDEKRLPNQSLVAAGGWCAPSEVSYNLSDDGSTTEGVLSLPEVGMGRGGIKMTLGPDFADLYALTNFFKMTEAQAIAGTFTKPCFTVTCPTFNDYRLDAYGYCFQIPFLTEAAYPEVIKRYLSGSMTAYAHKMNADKISRLVALLPAAETVAAIGSLATTLFGRIQLILDRERTKRRWSMRQAVEVVLPMWVKGAIKTDISLRTGTALAAITDAQINSLFSAVNAAVQWVYDWAGQDLGPTAVVYPSTFDMLVYKAGTFVVGTTNVVSLSSVYDAASLSNNIYTGAFFEEGMTMVRMGYGGVHLTVPTCLAGKTGAALVDCPSV